MKKLDFILQDSYFDKFIAVPSLSMDKDSVLEEDEVGSLI